MTKHPIETHLLTIINHFGNTCQNLHLEGEIDETFEAYEKYHQRPTKENLLHFIEELSDCMVLAKQLALKKGITLEEIAAMQPTKIARTIDIIIKSDKSKDPVQEYNRIRRGKND